MSASSKLLDGKVCIVTGASRGIGAASARALARHGAAVVVSSRDLSACESVSSDIAAGGDRARAFAADITKPDDMAALAAFAESAFGRVDLAFLNAGGLFGASSVADTSVERLRASLDANLVGPFLALRALVPAMTRAGGGAIVVNSASAGLRGRGGIADYAASKWGAIGLSLSAAQELGKLGIRINVIAPGFIATESWTQMMGKQADALAARVPLGRIGEPDDVADVVSWLLSDASRYVTGAVLAIDGGLLSG